ncbi:ImmA/IrrE family metallo-endopeptidase [Flavobacterium terrisoli]|uniref:ImmA/IrrE family metallo-endopeptidase n=1 Tax=Flavobacterium terrisoli TaxID=3242195 RepID=UPI0025432F25|nr:ImmA/IrrE family metallo-endopeptidase [Flavobacterium buctense]
MATSTTLKRGFKAKAERIATEYREKLGIHPCAPLCAFALAKFLDIKVHDATHFLSGLDDVNRLSGLDGSDCGWSALTMKDKDGKRLIIHNPFHTPARQQSNIMHEIAHILCEHKKKPLPEGVNLPFGMRDFDKEQEDEAIYLGATLQLSRPCLLWARKTKMTNAEIANYYNASAEMVNFRIASTGVNKQYFPQKQRF